MSDQDLVDYIRRYQDQYSMEQIRNTLLDQGYGSEEIDKAIEQAVSQKDGRRGPETEGRNISLISWVLIVLVLLGAGGAVSYGIFHALPAAPPDADNESQNFTSSNPKEKIKALYGNYCNKYEEEDLEGLMEIYAFDQGSEKRKAAEKFLTGYFESVEMKGCNITIQEIDINGKNATTTVGMSITVEAQGSTFSGPPQEMEQELVKQEDGWKFVTLSTQFQEGGSNQEQESRPTSEGQESGGSIGISFEGNPKCYTYDGEGEKERYLSMWLNNNGSKKLDLSSVSINLTSWESASDQKIIKEDLSFSRPGLSPSVSVDDFGGENDVSEPGTSSTYRVKLGEKFQSGRYNLEITFNSEEGYALKRQCGVFEDRVFSYHP